MVILETQRLLLQPWNIENIDDFHEILQNPACILGGWKPSLNKQESLTILKSYIESDDRWAIVLKDNKKAIGFIHLHPDNNRGNYYAKMISYLLNEKYWNKGYMTETVKCVIKYAFEELNIDLLSAFCVPQNITSKLVLEKCGFKYEMTIEKGHKRYDGKIFDSEIYSILKCEFPT